MVTTTSAVKQRWEELLSSLDASVDREALERTYVDVDAAYDGRQHWSGVSLMDHCLDLFEELLPFQPDTDAVMVCLLHHVPELHMWSVEDIERRYGARVRSMVGEMHVLQHLTTHNRRVSVERLRLNFFRVSNDVRVFLLIFCHQMLTMRGLQRLPVEESRRICGDALQLYAPAAARLGIYSLKHAFEDAAFPVLYPVDHERVTEQVQMLRDQHGEFLKQTGMAVQQALLEHGVNAVVEGREKHPYSIFVKMRRKTVNHISEIPDLFALRVVVDDEAACYQVLGFLHRLAYPVQNRFKDYIAFPKPNGYQSLHTTLLGLPHMPQGIMAEVQIRTHAMHREAHIGVAAHWSYKETGHGQSERSRLLVERVFVPEADEARPRLAGMADHMFVLTPHGDVVELPEGATPLDFAFQVHTAVGLSFKAAKVNGAIVPLNHVLENGDIVEIVRYKDPKPSPRWINLLKTAAARNRLKRYLSMGPEQTEVQREPAKPAAPATRTESDTPRTARVEGSIPMPTRIAKCCKPEPGEPLMGVIGRGGDVRIHRRNCKMLNAVNPERRIHALWSDAPTVRRGAKR